MANVWGKICFFFPATWCVFFGFGLRLRVGPGASWATSVGPINWPSSPVITQYNKPNFLDFDWETTSHPGSVIHKYMLQSIICFLFFTSMTLFFPPLFFSKKVISSIFMKQKMEPPTSQGYLLNPDFNASHVVLLALKQMTGDLRGGAVRRSLSARSNLPVFPHCPY